jgi:Sulfotransferase family
MPAPPASSEAPAGESPRPKVLYVMGAGRSGSTILGVALGNCAGFFFAGELNKWLVRGGTPSLADPERERFWSEVRARMPDASDLVGGAPSALERSSALLRPRSWRTRRRLRARYRAVAQDLYDAIAASTGADHIVDTSHYPMRAHELQALAGIDLYLLLLVRDPRAVVASLARKDVVERSFGTFSANAYLLLTHVVSAWVFLAHPRSRRLVVRHEELRAEPERVLRAILDFAGSFVPLPDLGALNTGVPLHGNRLARGETVALERSPEPLVSRSRVTRIVQLPAGLVLSSLRPTARDRREKPR